MHSASRALHHIEGCSGECSVADASFSVKVCIAWPEQMHSALPVLQPIGWLCRWPYLVAAVLLMQEFSVSVCC